MIKLSENPFENYSEKKLTVFGVLILLLASLVAFFLNARFDGILDMHFVNEIKLINPFLDNIINTVVLTFFLFTIGYFLNPKTRIWDVFNVALVARIPFYILPVFNIGNFMSNKTEKLLEMIDKTNGSIQGNLDFTILIALFFFTIISILALVLFGYLIYLGFKTATNSKSKKSIILLIITVIFGELISKILIHFFN